MIYVKCKQCGFEFTAKRGNRKYCDACNQKRKFDSNHRDVCCSKCGGTFPKYLVINGACPSCRDGIRIAKTKFNEECIEEEKKILKEAKAKEKTRNPVPKGHFSQVCKELSEKKMTYAEYQKQKTFEMIGGINESKHIRKD